MLIGHDKAIISIDVEGGSGKVPSGAMHFKEDWPGLWLRGDDCIFLLYTLEEFEEQARAKGIKRLPQQLEEIMKIIRSHIIIHPSPEGSRAEHSEKPEGRRSLFTETFGRLKPLAIIVALAIGVVVSFLGGAFIAGQQARVAVQSGPFSDNYGPARVELGQAISKLRAGDTDVIEHLVAADIQIERAQHWSTQFLGLQDGGAR